MKKCFVCGAEAKVFTGKAWICRDCYLKRRSKTKSKQQSSKVRPSAQAERYLDLELGKI